MFEGRSVDADDPEVASYQASKFGRQAIQGVKGNVFAHSTYCNFSVAALRRRGMYRECDSDRIMDHGLYILNRIRGYYGHRRWLRNGERDDKAEKRRQARDDAKKRKQQQQKQKQSKAAQRGNARGQESENEWHTLESDESDNEPAGESDNDSDSVDAIGDDSAEGSDSDNDSVDESMDEDDAYNMTDCESHLQLRNPHLARKIEAFGRTWEAQEHRQRNGQAVEEVGVAKSKAAELVAKEKRMYTHRQDFEDWYEKQQCLVRPKKKQMRTTPNGREAVTTAI